MTDRQTIEATRQDVAAWIERRDAIGWPNPQAELAAQFIVRDLANCTPDSARLIRRIMNERVEKLRAAMG